MWTHTHTHIHKQRNVTHWFPGLGKTFNEDRLEKKKQHCTGSIHWEFASRVPPLMRNDLRFITPRSTPDATGKIRAKFWQLSKKTLAPRDGPFWHYLHPDLSEKVDLVHREPFRKRYLSGSRSAIGSRKSKTDDDTRTVRLKCDCGENRRSSAAGKTVSRGENTRARKNLWGKDEENSVGGRTFSSTNTGHRLGEKRENDRKCYIYKFSENANESHRDWGSRRR